MRYCELVQLSIKSVDGMELYVNAYSVPTICSSLKNQAVELAVHKYPHLQGLKLADIPATSSEIEVNVLIGADYYWNFITGTVRRGESQGPVALKTKLGGVVSGPVVLNCKHNVECAVNVNSTHVLRVDTSPVQEGDEINEQILGSGGPAYPKRRDISL